jgi:hypothetical protein
MHGCGMGFQPMHLPLACGEEPWFHRSESRNLTGNPVDSDYDVFPRCMGRMPMPPLPDP